MTSRPQKRTNKREGFDEEEYESRDEYLSSLSMQSKRHRTEEPSARLPDWNKEEFDKNVKSICRYAMSCEYKRKTIRREELSKLLSEQFKKHLHLVLEKAREKMRHVYGFDIVELPSMKEKTNQSQTQRAGPSSSTQQSQDTQQPQATQITRKLEGHSGTFVLRSVLKEEYRTPEIIERSIKEYQLTGVLYVILGLIFVNGQSMTTDDLNGHLDRLKITKTLKGGVQGIQTREDLINEFVKDNYIKKSKRDDPDSEEPQFNYTWGPRAITEVGHAGITAFLLDLFYDNDDDSNQEARSDLQSKMWKQAGYTR